MTSWYQASHQLDIGRQSKWVQHGPSFPNSQLASQPACDYVQCSEATTKLSAHKILANAGPCADGHAAAANTGQRGVWRISAPWENQERPCTYPKPSNQSESTSERDAESFLISSKTWCPACMHETAPPEHGYAIEYTYNAARDLDEVEVSGGPHLQRKANTQLGVQLLASWKTVYYQLRTRTGEGISKTGNFLGNHPNLGRIDRTLVSPPHGSATLLRYIAKVEGKPIYTYSELHCGEEGIWAKQAIEGPFALMKRSSPLGWTEDKPMILVEPERRRELFNRPFKVLSGHRAAGWPHGLDPTGLCADKWKRGDLGFTDGFITQMYPFIALDMVHCNIHGMWGYLPKGSLLFLTLIHAIPDIR
ncbi:hypothetical protein B0H14DRAFT_3657561 [Mycena olivaceomarginata]|nr:hypothetical protein B0H14DRAFT_3657561 [Mycena olivaceomarginata]